ncbi:MAG: protein-export chaperone SecB [Alphaproteobacteria bacterium]|nr:protein-export chaperone SecB [Alphaproteobacteria bacterium]
MTALSPDGAPAAPVQIAVNNQYIKDFSFESPGAPQVFAQLTAMPALNVGVNVQTRTLAENIYEVVLMLKLEAKAGDKTAFIAELAYGGVITVPPVPEEALRFVLLVEAPRLLFPFARSIVANAVSDGGFPPLLINPIDFVALYQSQAVQMERPAEGSA